MDISGDNNGYLRRDTKLRVKSVAGKAASKLVEIITPVQNYKLVLSELENLFNKFSFRPKWKIFTILREKHRKFGYVDYEYYNRKSALHSEIRRSYNRYVSGSRRLYPTPELFEMLRKSHVAGADCPVRISCTLLKKYKADQICREQLFAELHRYKTYIQQFEKYQQCDNVEYHELKMIDDCKSCGVFRIKKEDHFNMRIFTETEFLYKVSYARTEIWLAVKDVQQRIKTFTLEMLSLESFLKPQAANVIKWWWIFRCLFRKFSRCEHAVKISQEDYSERMWEQELKQKQREELKKMLEMRSASQSFVSSSSDSISMDGRDGFGLMIYSPGGNHLEPAVTASFIDLTDIQEQSFQETHKKCIDAVKQLVQKEQQMDGDERHALRRRQLERNRELRANYLKQKGQGVQRPRITTQAHATKFSTSHVSNMKLPTLDKRQSQFSIDTSDIFTVDDPESTERSLHSKSSFDTSAHSKASFANSVHSRVSFASSVLSNSTENFPRSPPKQAHLKPPNPSNQTELEKDIYRTDMIYRVFNEERWKPKPRVRLNTVLDPEESMVDGGLSIVSKEDPSQNPIHTAVSGSEVTIMTAENEELLLIKKLPGVILEELHRRALDQGCPYLQLRSSAFLKKETIPHKIVLHFGQNKIGCGEKCEILLDTSAVDNVQCIIEVIKIEETPEEIRAGWRGIKKAVLSKHRSDAKEKVTAFIKDNRSSRGTYILNENGIFEVPDVNTNGYCLKQADNILISRSTKNPTLFELIFEIVFP